MDAGLAFRYAFREMLGLLVMGVALFWPAGRLDWCQGWAALALMLGWTLGIAAILLKFNPALLAERLGAHPGDKRWDVAILSCLALLQLARYIVAGLDRHNSWSTGISMQPQWIALVVCVAGHMLFLWALSANAYFSRIVRLQSDRGHTVMMGGPYGFVRHPGYLGTILFELGVAVLLASWGALLISLVTSALMIARTALEDGTLQAELSGYPAYARRVRWRLLPGVW